MPTEERASLEPDLGTVRRAVAAGAMGNCIEWFDYGVYSYVAATIGKVFFPSHSSTAALLSSFGVLAVSFVVRPFGGFFFGPLGDKFGRRRVLATTIILMSAATFVIGVLPSYAQVGVLAPVLLVLARLVQGFSTGGEYGGAATFIAEYAPDRRRGFMGSWLEFGTLTGFSLGAGIAAVCTVAIPTDSMLAWGWRIPFLVALPLGAIGLYLRTRLEDTPAFEAMLNDNEVARSPLRETVTQNWRQILNLIGIVVLINVADYTLLTYMPSYLTDTLKIGETTSLVVTIGVMLAMMLVIAPLGALSDRIGRKPVLMTACVGYLVLSYPAFLLMSHGSVVQTAIGMALMAFLLVLLLSVIGSTLPAMFPTRVRYGSFAIGYNLSTSAFGGTAPFVITALIKATGSNMVPAYYLMGAAVIAAVPIMLIRETAGASLRIKPGESPGLVAAPTK
jgi:MFS transporter, MHS family, proline/betaine transporter